MPRQPDPQVAQRWTQRLRRFEQSDLTVAQFCDREGVSSAAFYQWRRKLHAAASRDGAAPTPKFVPVQVVAEEEADGDIRIQLPNGVVVSLPGSLDIHKVCQLVQQAAGWAPAEDVPC